MATTTIDTVPSDNTPWHAIAADEVLRRLHSDPRSGLDTDEVSRRLERYGRNQLPEGRKRGPFMRFLMQFHNILIYVLLAAGFVKLMVGLWLDAAIILGVVVLNALLGFIQEGKAEKTLDSIRHMLSAEARTLRGEEVRMVPAEVLVPGDIVLLESGDKIPGGPAAGGREEPADGGGGADRRVGSRSTRPRTPCPEKATVGDREGMAFSGTLVAAGRATGVVVATGSHTELGRINQMMAAVSALETPLLRQIKKLGYTITAAIAVVSVIVFMFGTVGAAPAFRGGLPGGGQHRGVGDSRRAARADHGYAGHRRSAYGQTERHHPAAARGRDAWIGIAHLLRQDGHADADGDDGGLGGDGRIGLRDYGPGLRDQRARF